MHYAKSSTPFNSLQVLNTFYFLVGYLGFLSTWIMDTIFTFVRNPTLDWYNGVTSHTLRALSPHFVLARGLYDISQVLLLFQGAALPVALESCCAWLQTLHTAARS